MRPVGRVVAQEELDSGKLAVLTMVSDSVYTSLDISILRKNAGMTFITYKSI